MAKPEDSVEFERHKKGRHEVARLQEAERVLREVVASLYGLATVPHGYSERQRDEIIKRAGEVLRGQSHAADRQ